MSLWMQNNRLIYGDGSLTWCDACPCETGTGTGTGSLTVLCNLCYGGTASDEVVITIAGLSNNSCGSCASYNGSFVLPYSGSCGWVETWTNLIGSDPCNWGSLAVQVDGTYGAPYVWARLQALSLYRVFPSSPLDCEHMDLTLYPWGTPYIDCFYPATVGVKSR